MKIYLIIIDGRLGHLTQSKEKTQFEIITIFCFYFNFVKIPTFHKLPVLYLTVRTLAVRNLVCWLSNNDCSFISEFIRWHF